MKNSSIYKWSKNGAFLLVLILSALVLLSGTAMAGFNVQNGVLLDGNGAPFIMRGVNYPHVWYTSRTTQAINDMAGVGVNAVRVVLGSGRQWGPTPASEVKNIIEQLKRRKMIAVLEVHDCTGYGEKAEAAPMSTAVDYWLSIQNALKGQEDYVIINIANEPLGNNVPQSQWINDHTRAVSRLRNAGLTHTLMVDAANWGQDWEKIMYNNAPQVFNSDPQKNIVFSVHMYQVYSSRSTINDYMSKFVNQHKLPLVVGEFGADHQGQDVDEASILQLADQYGIGYLGWSWSGNSGGTESLDITINFNVNNLSSWGNTLINSTYGIRNTAEPATVFTGGTGNTDTEASTDTEQDTDPEDPAIPGCGETSGCGDTPIPQPDPTTDPTTDPAVAEPLFIGRFDNSDPKGPKASWSASTIKANFQGTSISVNLTSSGDNWFNVIIDDNVQTPINITPSTPQPVMLASGLAAGSHTIEIVKRTEAYQGEMQFLGFTFSNGGSLLAPPAPSTRRIEFIGDSITCGYGNEGSSQYETYTPKNENAYLAYTSIAARLLKADQITVAAGGKGIIRDYGGGTDQQIPEIYPRTIIWNSNLIWDYAQWIPQVVVINLATNDYSIGIPDRNEFTTAYANFVKKIRGQYADAVIYCAIGPMLWGDGLVSARDYVSSMVNQLQAQGDTKVKFIEFPMQTGDNGYGEDWHPSVKTHELMANRLAAQIRTDLGW